MGRYGKNPIVKPDDMRGVYLKQRRGKKRGRVHFGRTSEPLISEKTGVLLGWIVVGLAASSPLFFVTSFIFSFMDSVLCDGFFALSLATLVATHLAVIIGGLVTDHRLRKTGLALLIVWSGPLVSITVSLGMSVYHQFF